MYVKITCPKCGDKGLHRADAYDVPALVKNGVEVLPKAQLWPPIVCFDCTRKTGSVTLCSRELTGDTPSPELPWRPLVVQNSVMFGTYLVFDDI